MSKIFYILLLISSVYSLNKKFHHFHPMRYPYPKPRGELPSPYHGPFFRPPFEKREEIKPEFVEPIWEETHYESNPEQLPEYLILDEHHNQFDNYDFENDNFENFENFEPEVYYEIYEEDFPIYENLPYYESYQSEEIIPEYVNEDFNHESFDFDEDKFIVDDKYKRYYFPNFASPENFRYNKIDNNDFKSRIAIGRQH